MVPFEEEDTIASVRNSRCRGPMLRYSMLVDMNVVALDHAYDTDMFF